MIVCNGFIGGGFAGGGDYAHSQWSVISSFEIGETGEENGSTANK